MGDINELWNSPWRALQKNLASGSAVAALKSGQNPWDCDSPDTSRSQVPGRVANSWLVRARGRQATVPRIIQ